MSWLIRKLLLVLFWGSVAFAALLALFALGVGQLLPYLDHYRPQIENNLEQITGYPVTLERIDGHLEGIDPTVSISGFDLQVNGLPAISISETRVRLDTVKSILSLRPQFTYIRFVRPTLVVQEKNDQWRLNGETQQEEVKSEIGAERVLDYLSAQQNFSAFDATIKLDSEQYGQHVVRAPHVFLFQKSLESLLTSTFYLDSGKSPFQVQARIDETRALLGNYRIKASIRAPMTPLPLDHFLSAKDDALSSVAVGGDIWLDILVGKEVEVRTESTRLNAQFTDGQSYDVSSSLKLRYSQEKPRLQVDVRNVEIKDGAGRQYPKTNLALSWSSATGRSNLSFDQIDLSLAHQVGAYFLPKESDVFNLLDGLAPTGMAKNGSVRLWREEQALSFQLLSNIQSASVNGYNGIPQANNVNAVLNLSDEEGYIDFRGTGSTIKFDTIYDTVWDTESLSGYVAWQRQQEAFLVSGRDLSVRRNGADISGGFRLEIRNEAADWLSLDLNGRHIPIADRLAYLPPKALNSNVTSWIDDAFANTGQIDNLDVLVQSELSEGATPHVRVKMQVHDADVTFDKNWPTAKRVNGNFELDETGVSVFVASASLADLSVADITVSVPIQNGSAEWLNLAGVVEDDAAAILAMLQSTPLADNVLQPFAEWQLDGQVKGRFDVGVPFSGDEHAVVSLGLMFQDNDLLIPEIDLASYVSHGQLNYSSSKGITNSEFAIQALGGESHLVLSSVDAASGELAIVGDLSGDVGMNELVAWRKLPAAMGRRVSGKTSYSGKLFINQSQNGQVDLTITSDLAGVTVDLPEPVGKDDKMTRSLRVKVMQHEQDLVVDVGYADFVKSRFLLQSGVFVGGEVMVNGGADKAMGEAIPKGLVVTGDFERFYFEAWQPILADFSAQPQTPVGDNAALVLPNWLSRVDFIVDEVVVNPNNTWHNFKVAYNASAQKMLLVNADEVNFSFADVNGVPNLHFGFLSWNTAPTEVSDIGKKTEPPVSARQIPTMVLSVDQLYLNQKPYGDWQLTLSQEGDSLRIDPITSRLSTGHFNGHLLWQDKGEQSSVALVLSTKGADLAELTKKFSNEAFVTSKRFNVEVALNWQGHPFYFDRESVTGQINFLAENGNFSQVDELPAFMKMLGIFNIGALNRRLLLDFSDVYEPGLTYDEFRGALSLDGGILTTTSPVTITSPTAEMVLAGKADIVNETLDETLTATFPLTGALPLAGLLWGTPQIAGLLFITDKLIGDQLSKVTSVQYQIKGSFDQPVMTPVRYRPLERKK
ncbi:TIGR02099 family protein [Marinomonas sp. M1K-6]|uniref:TIGR02099 family protein n=2 Tax=Marinomonas profundi TaxID=2726122 RepID=A0A847R0F4_9GAMM|nr:TIGR02099 family protein [Marinomonas profundi]UDV04896.1 TIGR02099 family protein [Marinomonas profundi]